MPNTDLHKFCDVDIHSAIWKIKDTYANHPSIIEIKNIAKKEATFPVGNYMSKLTIETPEQYVKYVQS